MKSLIVDRHRPVPALACFGCKKSPADLPCYTEIAAPGQTAEDYVWENEGTLNVSNGHFLCDGCYIKAGMPSSASGWTCP